MRPAQSVVLVTGGARRIGAAIVRELHRAGMNVLIHYRASRTEAQALAAALNRRRPDSAQAVRADLLKVAALEQLAQQAQQRWGRLDALVNCASSYFSSALGSITEAAFDDLAGTNLKAPLFLIQACARHMRQGSVVNITDIHAARPMRNYSVYCAAKAGLASLTESLARELAPQIRVNAVAPGHILWAQHNTLSARQRAAEIRRVPLQRMGRPEEIAQAVRFLLSADAAYITGAVLPVDGGLRLL